ncbi:MAG: hypothetical protein BGO49_21645 [Planctomycetales bacterium 71-10]|nr:MAG: hypothetical protein BGO49_21645 [Planctomycetales bacterium 71-10]
MMGQDMNADSISRSEPSGAGSQFDALESLESRLWDRARRNLRLLYNGGRLAPIAAANAPSTVGPLVVVNPKI